MDKCWAVVYWSSFLLGSFAIPFFQNYWTAGHFSVKSRVKFALLQVLKRTVLALTIFFLLCILGGWLLKEPIITTMMVSTLLMSNVYGTAVLVLLLSYGITFLPYSLWKRIDTKSLLYEVLADADEIYRAFRDARVDFHTEVSICRNLIQNNTTGFNK